MGAGRCGQHASLFLASAPVARTHVYDAVRVDVERHLYLGHSARRRRDTHQHERPENLVVRCHLPLSLVHLYLHRSLPVRRRRKHLRTHIPTSTSKSLGLKLTNCILQSKCNIAIVLSEGLGETTQGPKACSVSPQGRLRTREDSQIIIHKR